MSAPSEFSRRTILAGLGAAAVVGLAKAALGRARVASASHAALGPVGPAGYLLSPGFIHLNTASLGATPRAVLDSKEVRDTLRTKYNIAVKMVEKQWFNGIRLSPHVLNTESDVDAVLRALRRELG